MKNLLTKKKIGSKLTVVMLLSLAFTNYVSASDSSTYDDTEYTEKLAHNNYTFKYNENVINGESSINYIKRMVDTGNIHNVKTYLKDHPEFNINQKYKGESTPFHSETFGNILIPANNSTLLTYAVENNNLEMAKLLVEHGADINSIINDKNLKSSRNNITYTYLAHEQALREYNNTPEYDFHGYKIDEVQETNYKKAKENFEAAQAAHVTSAQVRGL